MINILETWRDPVSDDMMVLVEGRTNPVRIVGRAYGHFEVHSRVAAALALSKASQIIPDNRHDRGWPKVTRSPEDKYTVCWGTPKTGPMPPLHVERYSKVTL